MLVELGEEQIRGFRRGMDLYFQSEYSSDDRDGRTHLGGSPDSLKWDGENRARGRRLMLVASMSSI